MTPDVGQVFEALSILEFHFKGRKRTTCFSRIDSHKFHYLVCYVYQHIDVDVLFVIVYVCPCCCFCFFFLIVGVVVVVVVLAAAAAAVVSVYLVTSF